MYPTTMSCALALSVDATYVAVEEVDGIYRRRLGETASVGWGGSPKRPWR